MIHIRGSGKVPVMDETYKFLGNDLLKAPYRSVPPQSEILEKSLVSEGGGILEGAHHGRTPLASASVMEHLQSLLKQKEGERANAQVISDNDNVKESLLYTITQLAHSNV